jgi:hypothetical protein
MIALAAGLLTGTSASAAGYVIPTKRERILVLGGRLEAGDAVRFREKLRSTRPDIVVLSHPKGRLDEAVLIAAEIRHHGLNTYLMPGPSCVSACAIMFLAGTIRFAESASRIAIYPRMRVNLGDGMTSRFTATAVLDWVAVPRSIQARITSSDELYWLDHDEKSQLGIVAIDVGDPAGAVIPTAYRSDKRGAASKPSKPRRRLIPSPEHKQLASVASDSTVPEAAGEGETKTFLSIPATFQIVDLSSGLSGVPYDDWYWAGHGIGVGTNSPLADLEKLVPEYPD